MPETSSVRIIGGKWRGRKLCFPLATGLRPTPSRIRETVFNWLQPFITNARCLDLFAGSGALGFEALSRGAASVVLVDKSRFVIDAIKKNINHLHAHDRASVIMADANKSQWVLPNVAYNIIFLDPPYAKGALELTLKNIFTQGVADRETIIYVEYQSGTDFAVPEGCFFYKKSKTKKILYGLLRIEHPR